MTRIKAITLSFNCPETLGENFRCEKCSRRIVDFTNTNNRELDEALKNSSGKVCGRFHKSQMSGQFLKYAAATALVTSLAMPAVPQELVKGDSSAAVNETKTEEVIFMGTIVDIAAEPVGGVQRFLKTITDNIVWPTGLKEKGKSFVQLTIDTTGQITDVRLLKGFNELADQEAVRVLSTLHCPFTPARQRGKAVRSTFVIPVLFDPGK